MQEELRQASPCIEQNTYAVLNVEHIVRHRLMRSKHEQRRQQRRTGKEAA